MGIIDSIKNIFVDPEEPENNIDEIKEYQNNKDIDYCLLIEKPKRYEDAENIAEKFKYNNAIIIDFKNISMEDKRRFLDFIFGVAMAIDGQVKKINDDIIVCCPKNIKLITGK